MAISGIQNYLGVYSAMMRRSGYSSMGAASGASPVQRVRQLQRLYGGEQSESNILDYKLAQQRVEERYEQQRKKNQESYTAMKKDSASFLDEYVANNEQLKSSAKNLMGKNLDKLLYDESGNVTDETLKKVSDAMQSMVDSHNKSITTMSENVERGSGVSKRLSQMQKNPASSFSMSMVGLSHGENGKLSFDSAKLTSALKNASESKSEAGMNLIKDVIGGSYGVAAKVSRTAQQNEQISAQSLIQSDLIKMKNLTTQNTLLGQKSYNAFNMYTGNGSLFSLQTGMTGAFINMLV